MNIAFWVLIIIIAILLWFLLAVIYRPVGHLFIRLFEDSKKAICDEERKDKDE